MLPNIKSNLDTFVKNKSEGALPLKTPISVLPLDHTRETTLKNPIGLLLLDTTRDTSPKSLWNNLGWNFVDKSERILTHESFWAPYNTNILLKDWLES